MAWGKKKDDSEDDGREVPWLLTCRVMLAIVACLGFISLYSMKVNMSVAIVCMVNHTYVRSLGEAKEKVERNITVNGTYITEEVDEISPEMEKCYKNVSKSVKEDGEFNWNNEVQSFVLGSYFWGYIITQVPGGYLAGRFGGKRVFGWCMFACSVSTILTPIGARLHYLLLLFLRFIAGLSQGVVWPSMHAIWAYWAPPEERSKLIGFTFAGAQIGNVVTFPLSALLCEYGFDGGWASIFYILGAVGILWFVAWMLIVSDTPDSHPRISMSEREYIQSSLKGAMNKGVAKMTIPWLPMVTSIPAWATIIAHMCANWITYTFLLNLPTYMKDVLHFDIKSNGFLSAVPYIGMWVTIVVSGVVADWIGRKELLSRTNIRKLFNTLSMLVPSIIIIILGFLDCTMAYVAVALVTIAISFTGCAYSAGYMVNPADIAPRFASILFGVSNTFGTIPGFLAPYTVGVLTPHKSQKEWQVVFYVAAAICLTGNVIYLLLGSAELQDWAKDHSEPEPESKKALPVEEVEMDARGDTSEKFIKVKV